MLTLEARSVGCRAKGVTGRMRTMAVFEHSVLLGNGSLVITLGSVAIGRGPLNVLLSDDDWSKVAGASGDWSSDGLALLSAGVVIRLGLAAIWEPPAWSCTAPPGELAHALASLRLEGRSAPSESLFHAAVGEKVRGSWPWQAAADDEMTRLRKWLSEGGTPPVGLVGLGPGATPAGDDLLAGVLVTLAALGDDDRRRSLAAAVRNSAAQRTTPLSAALLDAAGDGLAGEDLSAAIAALVSADLSRVPTAVSVAARHGATSGWDALGGAALVLATVSGVGSSKC